MEIISKGRFLQPGLRGVSDQLVNITRHPRRPPSKGKGSKEPGTVETSLQDITGYWNPGGLKLFHVVLLKEIKGKLEDTCKKWTEL